MKQVVLAIIFASTFSFADNFKLIQTAELKNMMKSSAKNLYIFDANTNDVRAEQGLVPTAKPLTNAKKYDVKKTLPSDKEGSLVFYCYNEQCMASHKAAERAAENGYKHVYVLADGIMGWKAKGEKVQVYKP